jgi:hypothetical protein
LGIAFEPLYRFASRKAIHRHRLPSWIFEGRAAASLESRNFSLCFVFRADEAEESRKQRMAYFGLPSTLFFSFAVTRCFSIAVLPGG